MTEPYIITLDAGTTGVKCSAFTRAGRALFRRPEASDTYYPHPGWAQQKPEEQLSAALRAVRALTEALDPAAAQALGLTGTMNGCIPMDADGNALYPNIIHSDNRTAEQADRTAQLIPLMEFYRVTGNRIDVHAGLPKYMWLKEHEPEVYARTWKFVNIKDYLYGHFTG
ncbi:MAG: gluconate kinase, partial [Clostridia bacterium]|nr:gluconate kinase [Clostridia bacterium]